MEDLQFLTDYCTDFVGGQDASRSPTKIPPESFYAGINVQVANGSLTPRWGVKQIKLVFPDETFTLSSKRKVSIESVFRAGRFQMMASYLTDGVYYLVCVSAGEIFFINQDTRKVQHVPIADGSSINENTIKVAFANASKYLVIFDFPNAPVIIEGVSARRADLTKYEVPVSALGAYNQNRLFISNAGNEFTGGDPTGDLLTPSAPITFEEVEAPSTPYTDQVFQLPTNFRNEPITAMAFLAVTDTSTGIGPLLVSTRNAIYSYQTQLPRAQWESNGFGTLFVSSKGIAGTRSFVNVNSDLFYLSTDLQVRSVSMGRSEQSKWSKVPVSREVQNWLKAEDPELVQYSTLGYFQNKILVTCNPYRTEAYTKDGRLSYDVAHGGLVVIGLDNLATLGHDGQPSWDGLWTPCRPMEIVTSNDRTFIMSKDSGSINVLYELDPNITYDVSEKGKIREITSTLYTRSYDCQQSAQVASAFQNKFLHSIDLSIQNVQGKFDLLLDYKPSHGSEYVPWGEFHHEAPYQSCGIPTDGAVNGLSTHNFMGITLGSPTSADLACDPVSKTLYAFFRRLQLKFTIIGKYWELVEYKLKSRINAQNELETVCDLYESAKLRQPCNNDWVIGPFDSCQ